MPNIFAAALIAVAFILTSLEVRAQVPASDSNWNSFLGNDAGTSYSRLDQINRDTVGGLAPVWMFSLGAGVSNSVPVVVDGILYVIGGNDNVYALDAATGRIKWTHSGGPVAEPVSFLRGTAPGGG